MERLWVVLIGTHCLSQVNMSREPEERGTQMDKLHYLKELNCGDLV